MAPLFTLLTDYGAGSGYPAQVKGVLLAAFPTARIVDLSHEVAAYEITEGAYVIAQAYRYFPPRTVHVVVVDPGVGTARRPILM